MQSGCPTVYLFFPAGNAYLPSSPPDPAYKAFEQTNVPIKIKMANNLRMMPSLIIGSN